MAGVEPIDGDLKDPASLHAACDGVSTVVTTANSAQREGLDGAQAPHLHGRVDPDGGEGARRSAVTLVRDGARVHALVAVDDVAIFAVAATTQPAAENAVLAIGGPEPVS